MCDAEAITQCLLLEVPKAGVRYVVKGSVRKEFQQRLMIYRYHQVLASQHEVACLVQSVRDCERLALYRRISGFCCVCKPATDQGYFPPVFAAEWSDW